MSQDPKTEHITRRVYSGRVIDLEVSEVTLPNGVTTRLELIRHPGGAAVVALDEKNRICMLRHYRHAAGGWLWELPAGKIDNREPHLETAQRELADEAGVSASDWTSLGQVLPSPAVFCEVIYLWLARGLSQVTQSLDEDELLEVHWLDFMEAWAMAEDGRIRDGKSLAGLLRARSYLYKHDDTDHQESR